MDKKIMERLSDNLQNQAFLQYVGARLVDAERGKVTFECDYDAKLSRYGHIFNGGFLATMADAACGYAAMSMVAEENDVLTIDLHISFLHPGNVKKLIAKGEVIKTGRTILVSEAILTDENEEVQIGKTVATFFTKPKKVYERK